MVSGMALPTRKQQIEAVAKFLDSDRNEGRSLEEIATEIVDGYLKAITPKTTPSVLRPGMLVKTLINNKAHRVAWIKDGVMWVVSETGHYGWLGPADHHFWHYVEEYRPKRRIDGKMVEMTDGMIEEAWSNPDWKVGDRVFLHQTEYKYQVLAVGPACVLLGDMKTGALGADSNANLAKYYKRESKGGDTW